MNGAETAGAHAGVPGVHDGGRGRILIVTGHYQPDTVAGGNSTSVGHQRDSTLRAVLLTAAHEPKTREKLRTIVERSLIGESTLGSDEHDRLRRSGLIASQLVGFALMRYVWKIEPIASMSDDDVMTAIAPNLQRYIDDECAAQARVITPKSQWAQLWTFGILVHAEAVLVFRVGGVIFDPAAAGEAVVVVDGCIHDRGLIREPVA